MASLTNAGHKRWRIQFVSLTNRNKRKQIRLRDLTKKQAQSYFEHIESIISARLQRIRLDDADARWLGGLPDSVHDKLVRAGLTEPRKPAAAVEPSEQAAVTLQQLLDEHIEEGLTSKGREASQYTKANWRSSKNLLLECFDSDRDITSITLDDGHQFRKFLNSRRIKKTTKGKNGRGVPMSENAKRKHIENAKTFFNRAMRRGLVTLNPFEHLPSSVLANRERDFYVTPEMTAKILKACPETEWRVLIGLWRLVGLRKTEVFWLSWGDVLWDQGKMLVHATKTAGYEGKDTRYVPIRDIRDDLWKLHESVAPGTERIITRFSATNTNLDKPLKRILHNAGLIPWPKLFQNMRASCETDWLNEGHPAHVVAGWIGHSLKVQRQNYAQITEGHYDTFNARETAAEKWLRFGYEDGRNGANRNEPANSKPLKTKEAPQNAVSCEASSTGGGTRTRTGFTPTGF